MPRKVVNAGILGVGHWVPERVVTNAELENMVDTDSGWIYARTGIHERRIASAKHATSDLAVAAAKMALEAAGTTPEEVDLIIVATSTPDMVFPSTACLVQDRLGVKKDAGAFDLAAACSGFIHALVTGSQYIAAGTYRRVLVIGAEVMSRAINWEDRSTCVLFGDGAGAVVLGPVAEDRGILALKLYSNGAGREYLSIPAGGSRRPASQETLDNKLHYIQMNGMEVFKFAVRIVVEASEEVIRAAGLKKEDIDLFVLHQANLRIIEPALKKLGVPMEKAIINLDKYANTSAASIPLALSEAVQGGRIKAGDRVVLVGFGGGLAWGAVALKW
jgi:3-oxoacyl-[acyl-carrier-protein] synthase-3